MQFSLSFLYPNAVLLGAYSRSFIKSVIDFLTAHPVLGYPALVVATSVVTFLVYGWDKRQSKTKGWRVSEKRLHTLAFLGGWPGAMLGQKYFRHKTQKSEFKTMTWLAAGLHAALLVWYLYSQMTK